jgi:hypothetical protein
MHKTRYTDYIFWTAFLLFTNPGGIQNALKINAIGGGFTFNDVLFPILLICFVSVAGKLSYDNDFKMVGFYMGIFSLYYFFVFGFLSPIVNSTINYSFIPTLIKLRWSFYSLSLFFFVYVFMNRSFDIFKKIFFVTSVLILILFLQSFVTKLEILPTEIYKRRFIEVDRLFLISYGLLPLLVPLGAVALVFNYRGNDKVWFYSGFILMLLTWIVSLTRRNFIGSIIYVLLAYLLYIFLVKNPIIRHVRIVLRTVAVFVLLIFVLNQVAPKYYNAGKETFENALIVLGIANSNQKLDDPRLALDKAFIMDIFKNNPTLGTGFDNRWRTGEGDAQGYEAADYPFLSALAMNGIIGILFFFPIYASLLKFIITDLGAIRKTLFRDDKMIFLISFLVFFIYEFLRYMDWFLPMSNAEQYYWFCMAGMYLAIRRQYYEQLKNELI